MLTTHGRIHTSPTLRYMDTRCQEEWADRRRHSWPQGLEIGSSMIPIHSPGGATVQSVWILKSNQHKLNKVMYDILYNLHCKDIHSSGWIKYINTIFQNNGMSYIWATQDFNVDSNNVYKCECDQFKQLWHSRITCDAIDSNNMMYKTFKYSHGKEKYTEILPEHFKKALLQFRIGSHKLPVNNRKHFNVPRADRHCTHCDQSLMGDEIHFLYECPKLHAIM